MANIDAPIRMHLAVLSMARSNVPGMLVLYPDKLAHVRSRIPSWCAGLGFAVVAVLSFMLAHSGPGAIGGLVGAGGGMAVGSAIARRQVPQKVAAGGDSVTVIPLDSITSITSRKRRRLRSSLMVVSTLDDLEFAFRANAEQWSAHLAGALTARGRNVQTSPAGLAVLSPHGSRSQPPWS
jgi:hypothetical protein